MILFNIINFIVYILTISMLFLQHNPLLCTLFLATTVFMSTIILLLTHVEFLAYIFILVYVGGIAILFLFIIIMLNIKASSLNKQSAKNNLIYGFFFSIIFFLKLNMLFLLLKKSFINSYFIDHFSMTKFPALHPGDDTLNIILSNDIKVFGLILYTHYFFYFLLVGLILLVTMVCVLVLALNKPLDNLEEYKPVRIKTKEKELMVDLYNKFFKKKYSTHEPRLNFMVNNTPIIVPCKGPRDWDLEWLRWPVTEPLIDGLSFIPLYYLTTYAMSLFFLSALGLIISSSRSVINFMLFVELMLFSLSFLSIAFSLMWINPTGQIFALFIMSIAVAESAVGLGLLIASYKIKNRIELADFSYLKG